MIVRELLAKFGVAYDDAGARKADADVGRLSDGLKGLIGIVGGAALVRGFGQFLTQQVEIADAVGDTATKLGIGVEALQELRFAGQDVGLTLEGVDAALGRLVRGSAEAARGQGEAKDAFKELGVSLTDEAGNLRSFDDVLAQVADGLGGTATDADRLRLSYKLFGREGAAFGASLKDGSAGLEEMRERARELGGVLSQEQVDAADKADKALQGYRFALGGLRNQIAQYFIPALTKSVEKISGWVRAAKDMIGSSNILAGAAAAAAVGLAALLATFAGSKLLALTKAGVALGLIALAVDELITFAKGGDSGIGRLLDEFKGMGSSVVMLDNIKAGWKMIAEWAEQWYGNLKAGWAIMQEMQRQRAAEESAAKETERRAQFDSEHAAWKRRKKWNEDHPDLPAWAKMTVGPEPVWKPGGGGGNSSAWEELRTRKIAASQGPGYGPLAIPGGAQSAEEAAAERRRLSDQAAMMERTGGKGGAPVTVNQTNSLTVNATGTDPAEVERRLRTNWVELHDRTMQNAYRAVKDAP